MRLGVTLDILNQKATPAFYADTLANRPAAGYTGRVFISTDTYDLYRDTGTTWVLLSPSSSGTITGTGLVGQVSYWSSASSITGTNNLFWDSANNRLGVNTNTPTSSFDVHSNASTNVISQLNQLSVGFDSLLAFQDNNIGKWRIGNYYNGGNHSFGIYDTLYSQERFSIQNGGTTFVGAQTSTSGLFNINSATSDNHLVVIGANAPSMRVRNAGSAATYQFGLGLATTTNNFIQGTIGGEFCLFNDSSVASPILFGIKSFGLTNEVARFSSSSNFLVGSSVDNGQKLQVSGTSLITGAASFSSSVTAASIAVGSAVQWNAMFYSAGAIPSYIQVANGSTGAGSLNGLLIGLDGGGNAYLNQQSPFSLILRTNSINVVTIKTTGIINFSNVPTSSVGLVTGDIYSSAGVLMIV